MYVLYFQDPVNSHKKFILECYKRLEVSWFPLKVPLALLRVVNIFFFFCNHSLRTQERKYGITY